MNGRGRGGGASHGLTHPREILFCDRVPGLGGEGLIKNHPTTKGMVYLILLFIRTIKSEQKWSAIIKCTSFYNKNQYINIEHTAFLKIILGWKVILTSSSSRASRCSFSRSSLIWRLERNTRWASWLIWRRWLSLSVSDTTSLTDRGSRKWHHNFSWNNAIQQYFSDNSNKTWKKM